MNRTSFPGILMLLAALSAFAGVSANCPSEASNQNVLAVVNRYRALHGAQALVWDADLAKRAQDWADLCTRQHSNSGGGRGENLWLWGNGKSNAPDFKLDGNKDACEMAADWFYSEVNNYNWAAAENRDPNKAFEWPTYNSTLGSSGHLATLVWAPTTKLGLGVAECPVNGGFQTYVVFLTHEFGQGQLKDVIKRTECQKASKDDGCAECSGAECTKCYSGLGFTEPVGPTKSCLNSGGGSDVPQTGEGTDTPPTGEGAEGNITSPTGESTDMPPTGGEGTGTPPIDGQGTDGEGTGTPPTNGEGTGMPLNVEGGDTPPPGEGTGDPPLPDDVGDTLPPLGEGSDTPSSTESTSGDGTGTPSTGGGTGGTPPPGEGTDTPPTVTSTPTEVLPSLLFIGVNITATAENGIDAEVAANCSAYAVNDKAGEADCLLSLAGDTCEGSCQKFWFSAPAACRDLANVERPDAPDSVSAKLSANCRLPTGGGETPPTAEGGSGEEAGGGGTEEEGTGGSTEGGTGELQDEGSFDGGAATGNGNEETAEDAGGAGSGNRRLLRKM